MLDFQIVTRLRIVSKIIGKAVYFAYIYRCAKVYLNTRYKVLFATNWKICNIFLRQVYCKENGLKEMDKYARKRNKIHS